MISRDFRQNGLGLHFPTLLFQSHFAVYGVSIEPCLSDIDLGIDIGHGVGDLAIDRLGWVIVGGESGHNRRPAKIEHIRDLKDQCVDAGVAFFLKQMEIDGKVVKMPELDGKIWSEIPNAYDENKKAI